MQSVAAICLLGKDGARLLASYSPGGPLSTVQAQSVFEKDFLGLMRSQYESAKKGTHIAGLGELVVVFVICAEFYLAVVADRAENELLLQEYTEALCAAMSLVCGKDFSLKALQKNYCELMLVLDEAFDSGQILSTHAEEMVARSMMQELGGATKLPAKSAIKGLFSLIG